MRKYDEVRRKKNTIISDLRGQTESIQQLTKESRRVAEISKNAPVIITDLDRQFEKATKLEGVDITFLLFAIALQCVRQYIIGTLTQRTGDQEAAKKVKGGEKEKSNRSHKLYHPSLEEIITNPVPFDATFGSRERGLNIGGPFTHRARTLGHDPILGWIFGTMNIATSTLTIAELGIPRSFHIKTGYTAIGHARDKIDQKANTLKIIEYSNEKLFHEGIQGKQIMGVSLLKEAQHLRSDMFSTVSLPLPVISSISVEYASKLADYGLDMGNVIKVGSQAVFAMLINSLVAMIHGLFYKESKYESWNLYSVKTRRILSCSNVIASASNVIAVAITAAIGAKTGNEALVKKSLNYLDIGGIMVTIYRIVNDQKFIKEVKQEFISQHFYDLVMGDNN